MSESIYLLYGTDNFIIKSKTNQIITKADVDDFNVTYDDAEEINVESAVNDASTIPFITDKKIVVIKNAYLLSTEKLKKEIPHNLDALSRYLNNPVAETILIINAPYDKLDERKAITKLILKVATTEKCIPMKEAELGNWVRRQLSKVNVNIDKNALDEVLKRVSNNTEVLVNETKKLVLYAQDMNRVDIETVKKVITKNVEDNVYEITNNILDNKRSRALEIYNDLVMHSEDPLRILGILVNKYREILHVKLLIASGKDKTDVASYYRASPGRAFYMIKNASSVNMDIVKQHLKSLEKLDYQIKSGQIDKKIGLELFILGT